MSGARSLRSSCGVRVNAALPDLSCTQAIRTARDTPCSGTRCCGDEVTAEAASTRAPSGNELQPAVTIATAVVNNNKRCFIGYLLNERTFKDLNVKTGAQTKQCAGARAAYGNGKNLKAS